MRFPPPGLLGEEADLVGSLELIGDKQSLLQQEGTCCATMQP